MIRLLGSSVLLPLYTDYVNTVILGNNKWHLKSSYLSWNSDLTLLFWALVTRGCLTSSSSPSSILMVSTPFNTSSTL